jgi:hypothetical protein
LIPPDDVDGFAAALRRYRDMPRGDRERLGSRCKRLVEERFGLEAMHRAYVPIYTYVMGPRADRESVQVVIPPDVYEAGDDSNARRPVT